MEDGDSYRKGAAFFLALFLGGLALFFIFYSVITPDMYKMINPLAMPLGYIFVPDDDEFEGRAHLVIIAVPRFGPVTVGTVTLHYKTKNEATFRTVAMQNIVNGSNWAGELPTLKKGNRWFYYIEISYLDGSVQKNLRIPAWAPGKPLAYVTFEGKPSKALLLCHIVIILGSAFFLLHGFYFAIAYLQNRDREAADKYFKKSYNSVLWGWILFTFSALILGYYIAWVTFGVGWSGLPIGDDITDNKSLLTIIFWAVLLLVKGKAKSRFFFLQSRISEKAFCIWLIIGIILTTMVYLIPHSFFLQ